MVIQNVILRRKYQKFSFFKYGHAKFSSSNSIYTHCLQMRAGGGGGWSGVKHFLSFSPKTSFSIALKRKQQLKCHYRDKMMTQLSTSVASISNYPGKLKDFIFLDKNHFLKFWVVLIKWIIALVQKFQVSNFGLQVILQKYQYFINFLVDEI